MKKMHSLVDECSKYLIENLESHVVNGKEVIVKDVFGCLTMDVIAKCAFGIGTNAHKDKNNPFVVYGRQFFEANFLLVLISSLIPKSLSKMIGVTGGVGLPGQERANPGHFTYTLFYPPLYLLFLSFKRIFVQFHKVKTFKN